MQEEMNYMIVAEFYVTKLLFYIFFYIFPITHVFNGLIAVQESLFSLHASFDLKSIIVR